MKFGDRKTIALRDPWMHEHLFGSDTSRWIDMEHATDEIL
jgi:hypothetical protein